MEAPRIVKSKNNFSVTFSKKEIGSFQKLFLMYLCVLHSIWNSIYIFFFLIRKTIFILFWAEMILLFGSAGASLFRVNFNQLLEDLYHYFLGYRIGQNPISTGLCPQMWCYMKLKQKSLVLYQHLQSKSYFQTFQQIWNHASFYSVSSPFNQWPVPILIFLRLMPCFQIESVLQEILKK